jgi:hypothetical protein
LTTALIGASSQALYNQDDAARDDVDSPPVKTAVPPLKFLTRSARAIDSVYRPAGWAGQSIFSHLDIRFSAR